jgi:two-component system chemotaxis response regulator CheY
MNPTLHCHVLVVDDSPILRSAIKKVVKLAGVPEDRIFEAGNGRAALERLEQSWIDIVFADINMPVMTGIELVDQMVARDLLKASPVVIISTERSETRIVSVRPARLAGMYSLIATSRSRA